METPNETTGHVIVIKKGVLPAVISAVVVVLIGVAMFSIFHGNSNKPTNFSGPYVQNSGSIAPIVNSPNVPYNGWVYSASYAANFWSAFEKVSGQTCTFRSQPGGSTWGPPVYQCALSSGDVYFLTAVNDPLPWSQTYCATFSEGASYPMVYGTNWILSYNGNGATFPPDVLSKILSAWSDVTANNVLINAPNCQ